MKTQEVHVNDKDEATIRCTNCGREKILNVSSYKHHGGPVKVRCACSFVFPIVLEKRRNYRKGVHILADYSVADPGRDAGQMVVINLSPKGLGFQTLSENDIKPNDIVNIRLLPDDVRWDLDAAGGRSMITKKVLIRHVQGRSVGASFCSDNIGKLARYL